MINTLKNEFKSIFGIAGPIIMAQLFFMGIDISDSLMAGLLGEKELACVATAGSFVIPIILFVIGIKAVLSPIISTHMGQKKYLEIGHDVFHMALVGLVLSIPIMGILFFNKPLLEWIGINSTLISDTAIYLRFRSFGIIPLFLFGAYRYYFEGIGKTSPIMFILSISFIFNIILNFFFIYGIGPFPQLGVLGIGLSTAIVDYVLFFSLFCFEKIMTYHNLHKLKLWYTFDKNRVTSMLKIGVPSGFLYAIEVFSFAIIGVLIAKTTTVEMVSHQIALNISALTYMVPLGLSGAMASRIGYLRGENNIQGVRRCIGFGLALIIVLMIVASVVIFIFRKEIPLLYQASPAVFEKTRLLLLIIAGYQIVDGLQSVTNGILRGFKDTVVPMFLGLCSYWLLGFVPGYYLANSCGLGVLGYWWGVFSGLSFGAMFLGLRLRSITKMESIY